MARAAKRNGRPTKTPPARTYYRSTGPPTGPGLWYQIDTGLYEHATEPGCDIAEPPCLEIDYSAPWRLVLAAILRDLRATCRQFNRRHPAHGELFWLRAHVKHLRAEAARGDHNAAVNLALLIGRYWERLTIRPLEPHAATGKRTRENLAAGQAALKVRRSAAQDEREAGRKKKLTLAQKSVEQARRQLRAKHPTQAALEKKAAKILGISLSKRISPRTIRRWLAY